MGWHPAAANAAGSAAIDELADGRGTGSYTFFTSWCMKKKTQR